MKRGGRPVWSVVGAASVMPVTRPVRRAQIRVAQGMSGQYPSARGFARLPPRAKPPTCPESPGDGGQLVQGGQDFGGVASRLDLGPDPGDPPVRRDQERGPDDPHVGSTVVRLLGPSPVGIGRLAVLVGQQGERKLELLAEGALAGSALGTDPPHIRATLVDRVVPIAKIARFGGAAGRVVLRVEIEDGPASTLLGEAMDGPGVIGKSNLGGRIANGGHTHRPSLAGDSTTSSSPLRTTTLASDADRTLDRPRAGPSGSGSSISG